jgi:ADP-ribosylation factor 1/2
MGNISSSFQQLLESLWKSVDKDARILLVGLDAAGKTTILYKLKLGEQLQTVPTIGFNTETLQINKLQMTMWDIGAQYKVGPLWRHYFQDTDALVWVVDSCDRERFSEAKEQLHALLNEPKLANAVVLVYANKSDLPMSADNNTLCKELELASFPNRKWFIQQCCATTGEGLYEGMAWLADAIKTGAK